MNKLLLIDGNSILNRAFYGLPDLTASDGRHTNAVLGFLNIILKVIDEEKATHVCVAFDVKEPTFRHKMYSEYKGTRHAMPDELREQVPLIKEVLKSMNIFTISKAGYEADDILSCADTANPITIGKIVRRPPPTSTSRPRLPEAVSRVPEFLYQTSVSVLRKRCQYRAESRRILQKSDCFPVRKQFPVRS